MPTWTWILLLAGCGHDRKLAEAVLACEEEAEAQLPDADCAATGLVFDLALVDEDDQPVDVVTRSAKVGLLLTISNPTDAEITILPTSCFVDQVEIVREDGYWMLTENDCTEPKARHFAPGVEEQYHLFTLYKPTEGAGAVWALASLTFDPAPCGVCTSWYVRR